jgi:hypothetical protein
MLTQISVYFTIFGLSTAKERCDKAPLNIYIVIEAIRLVISTPLVTYNFVLHYYDQLNQNQREVRQETNSEKAKNLLDLFATLWFVLGNWWLFAASDCSQTAPMLYYLSLSMVILGYVILLFPVFMILSIIFCLPLVLIILRLLQRFFGISFMEVQQEEGTSHRPQGLTKEMLSRIEKKKYAKGESIADEDAHCVICLGDYVPGEYLKILPCGHHFHATCTDEWLVVNRKCPLCVRDVGEELEKKSSSPPPARASTA